MNAIERIDTLIERNTHQLNLMGFCLDGESSQEEINKMKYGMGFLVIANKDLEWVKESVTETTCSDVEKSLRGLLRHVDRLIKSLELRYT